MTTYQICPVCEAGKLTPTTFTDSFSYKGMSIKVDHLQGMTCDRCSADPILTQQILINQQKIADAKRVALHMFTGEQIRQIRERLKISQKESSLLFGGGTNAFSKYERGEVIQSDAMDALLYLVDKFPFTLDALRHRHGIPVSTRPVNEMWLKSDTPPMPKHTLNVIQLPNRSNRLQAADSENSDTWKRA